MLRWYVERTRFLFPKSGPSFQNIRCHNAHSLGCGIDELWHHGMDWEFLGLLQLKHYLSLSKPCNDVGDDAH